MKRRYFIKMLITFLIPLLVPLIILGTLATYTTQHDLKRDINQNSYDLLYQSQHQLEMILSELETLELSMVENPRSFLHVATVLREPSFSRESLNAYTIIMSYLNAITSSKPYIHSVYYYVDNQNNRFISSTDGVVDVDRYHDQDWYNEFMQYEGPPTEWTATRMIQDYEHNVVKLVTIYNIIDPGKVALILNIRPQYINTMLNNIATYEDQRLFVLDGNNQIIFTSKPSNPSYLTADQIERIAAYEDAFFDMEINGMRHNVTKVESSRYNWKVVSLIPHESLYETPSRILSYTFFFAGVSFVCGLAIAFWLTHRNYRQLLVISSLIKSAEKNITPPKLPKKVSDEYSYIIQNMIAHFIEHQYIKTQLSEKKYRLQAAELLALQSQMNPHFLYNTLHSIYWETVGLTGKPNKASEMVERLSDLLRYCLSNPTDKVTWEEEIRHTRNYLFIQKHRYKDRFNAYFEVDEEVLGLHTMRLILQPLVENSLYHGIKEKPGSGLIKIKIYPRDERLRILVIDNGVGIPPETLNELKHKLKHNDEQQDPHQHIGLINTVKRLALMYNMHFQFIIRSKEGWGTSIMIEVPLHF